MQRGAERERGRGRIGRQRQGGREIDRETEVREDCREANREKGDEVG